MNGCLARRDDWACRGLKSSVGGRHPFGESIRGLAGRVRIGAPDASLTPASGVVAVAELAGRLGMVAALDEAVGGIKQRDRGLSAGGLLLALAQTQMLGGDFLVSLDRRRDDLVGECLSAVPTPASTTAAGLAARFGEAQLVGIEDGIGEITRRAVTMLPAGRRTRLRTGSVTIDLDGTDVEVYGAKKDGIAYTYKGARAGRPHVATWAEAGLVVAADLLAGDEDPRPGAADLIDSAVATLHIAGVTARPRVRGDVGYFAADIAWAAVEAGCDFSLGVTRNKAAWRAAAAIPGQAWTTAKRMQGAQVAVMDYAPAGWPPDVGCVVRPHIGTSASPEVRPPMATAVLVWATRVASRLWISRWGDAPCGSPRFGTSAH